MAPCLERLAMCLKPGVARAGRSAVQRAAAPVSPWACEAPDAWARCKAAVTQAARQALGPSMNGAAVGRH